MSMTDARDAGLLIHCTLRYTYGHATSVRGRAGYINGITPQFIRDHLTSGVKGPGTKKKPRDGPPRWRRRAAAALYLESPT